MNLKLNSNGYTIVDLLMVMLIIAILLAIAQPVVMNYIDNCQLTATAVLLQEDLRTLGQQALVEENSGLRIKIEPYRYLIYDSKMTSHQKEVIFPRGIFLYHNNFGAQVYMSPRGMPVASGHLIFRSERTGKMKYVIITPVTGRIRVSDYPSES